MIIGNNENIKLTEGQFENYLNIDIDGFTFTTTKESLSYREIIFTITNENKNLPFNIRLFEVLSDFTNEHDFYLLTVINNEHKNIYKEEININTLSDLFETKQFVEILNLLKNNLNSI